MPVFKRRGKLYVDVTTPSGKRIRRSARTPDPVAAQELHDRLKAESWRQDVLGEKPKRTWEECALRYLREKSGLESILENARHIRFWTEHFRGMPLEGITRGRAGELVEEAYEDPCYRNRVISSLRGALKLAEGAWEWGVRCPSFRRYKEPKRVRWIQPSEALRLLEASPEHYRPIITFSLQTGWRQSNAFGLKWEQIDLQRRVAWVNAEDSKNGHGIPTPLTEEAVEAVRSQLFKHPVYVFTRDGEPLKLPGSKLWGKILKASGIENFRWHDLRHTWASWHVQRGTPLPVLMELGGWKSMAMVMRYAHLGPEHLQSHAERVSGLLSTAQPRPTEEAVAA
jgi:integrase